MHFYRALMLLPARHIYYFSKDDVYAEDDATCNNTTYRAEKYL